MPHAVSVIIPTYRRPDVLPSCLDGLERQTHPPHEVIVVDQSPDARTRDCVLARAPSRFSYRYLHSDVAGVSLARNLGLREAKGSVVAFTEDDAVPEPGWIASLVDAFETTSADLVGGKILGLWEGTRPPWFPSSRAYLVGVFDPGGDLSPFPDGSLPMTGNLAVRREVIERVGGFDEAAGPKPGRPISGEDSLFAWHALGAGFRIFYQPEAVVHHRVPRARMKRSFYLRRCYREGVSLMDVEHKRGILTPERLDAMVAWHRKNARRRFRHALGRVSLAPWNDPKVLEDLGEAALSAGVVSTCLKLRRGEAVS
jgi:GT2 family glycosyltransferase